MKKILVALLVAMLALIATVALAAECPTHGTAGHVYDTYVETTKNPTCTSLGVKVMACSCGAETTADIAQVECVMEHIDYVAPTCQTTGYDLYACKWCNETYKNEYAKVACDMAWKTVPATCTVDGYTIHACKWCGAEDYREIEYAQGHTKGEYVKSTGKDTCTTDKVNTYKCGKCGTTWEETVNDITGHKFGEWKLTTKGNCIKDGEQTRYCVNGDCTAKETRTVVAKGHQILEDSIRTNNKGVVVGYCTVCGEFVPVDEKPVVTPEVKPEDKPEQKPEQKPSKPSKPSTPNKPTTNKDGVTIPATGETMNVAPFIMMLVAIVGLAVTKQKVTE
jgi:transposase-like protein